MKSNFNFSVSLDSHNRLNKIFIDQQDAVQLVYVGDGTQINFKAPVKRLSPQGLEILRTILQSFIIKNPETSGLGNIQTSPLNGRISNDAINFVARMEYFADTKNRRDFFFNEYSGRSYPFSPVYASECGLDPSLWSFPNIKMSDVPKTEGNPWRNVIDMQNSKDGKFIDELYIQPRKAYPACTMKIIAKVPDPATLPDGAVLLFGFEVNSQGGNAIFTYIATGDSFAGAGDKVSEVRTRCMTPTGLDSQSTAVVIQRPNVYSIYWLDYDPYSAELRMWQQNAADTGLANFDAATLKKCTIGATKPVVAYPYVSPFIANESSLSVVKDYYVGHWSCWQVWKP